MYRTYFKVALVFLGVSISAPGVVMADNADGASVIGQPWEHIVQTARGGEVNFFLWGGAANINAYVSDYLGDILKQRYDITLNRVGLSDTVEAVNIVLGEKEAGVTDEGSVDLIWVNGENFRTMKQAGLAFCGYIDTLPNNVLVNWDNPSIASDFGVPVDGCEVPWSRAQFAFAYDSERLPNPPQDMAALLEWIKNNSGQFTYPAPPDFNGSAFVRHVFLHAAGSAQHVLGSFDQARFDMIAEKTWAILNDIEPHLWRKGTTYPNSIGQLKQLFANREVMFHFDYDPSQFGLAVNEGTFPASTRSYGLKSGTIGNTNYVVIPFNSPNKAATMVLANLILSGEAQLQKARPEVWGASPVIELDRVNEEVRQGFKGLQQHPSIVSFDELGQAVLPEMQADWLTAIEKGWRQNVGQ